MSWLYQRSAIKAAKRSRTAAVGRLFVGMRGRGRGCKREGEREREKEEERERWRRIERMGKGQWVFAV